MSLGRIQAAGCQFPVSESIERNAGYIKDMIAAAAADGAEVVQFGEAALTGYGGHDFISWELFDWVRLRRESTAICQAAADHGVYVILGSAHRLTALHKPHDCLYVIGRDGNLVDRYDKRFCTKGDLVCYSPGDRLVSFEINGVRCGLAIGFDFRFPELFRAYRQAGIQCLFHSFHHVGAETGMLTTIVRPTVQGHAASNHLWISAVNASNYYQMWPSCLIRPDGNVVASMRQHRTGYLTYVVETTESYYDASGEYRERAMSGILNSADPPADPRSDDRTHF